MRLLEHFLPARIAVALSGGADSVCLALLAQKWAQKWGVHLTTLTVDHGLRAESKREARQVATQMKALGISHHTLRWTGEKPTSGIEEKARDARYQLLCDFCRRKKIPVLLLAHHAQDNIETFFLRLAKASGLTGLSAIHPLTRRDGILLMRPLLTVDKADIIHFLTCRQISWVEDPMNQNPVFERVQWRKQIPTLQNAGLKTTHFNKTFDRLRRAERALNQLTDKAVRQIHIDPRGFVQIPYDLFDTQPEEIQIRIMQQLIPVIGDADKPISLDRLEKILTDKPTRTTIGNCYLIRHKNGLIISKEPTRMPNRMAVPAKKWVVWDRFKIYASKPVFVQHRTQKDKNCTLPLLVQQSFAFLTDKKGLEICPDLDYKANPTHINVIIQFLPLDKG